MSTAADGERPTPAAVAARLRRILGSTVLVAEAFVVWFALLAAAGTSDLSRTTLLAMAVTTVAACLLVAGLLGRRGGYVLGTLLQGVVVAAGVVVPAMFLMGALFAVLWVGALVLAERVRRIQEAHLRDRRTR